VMAAELVPQEGPEIPAAVTDAELMLAHDASYVSAVVTGSLPRAAQRRIGFPWSEAMVERSRRSAGATLAACRAALELGTGITLAGGTHHASAGRGEGYCVFNDAAVAIRVLQRERRIDRVLVIDTDVHQGNGTAAIFRTDSSVFTLDLYAERNFPFEKEACDLAVPLPDGTHDPPYLEHLASALDAALGATTPDLAVYVSGADSFEGDRLGRLSLTKAGLAARDDLVISALRAAAIPVAVTMAGGYAVDIRDTVDIHVATVRRALDDR
jgi:acetoin utilization deacetylase AcuC-like enzyme